MAELNHFNFLYRQYFTLVKVYKKCIKSAYYGVILLDVIYDTLISLGESKS